MRLEQRLRQDGEAPPPSEGARAPTRVLATVRLARVLVQRIVLAMLAAGVASSASAQTAPPLPPWSHELSDAARAGLEANDKRPPAPDSFEGRRARSEAIQQEIGVPRLTRWKVAVDETEIAGVPVRILHRAGQGVDWRKPGPILLNLHGGGFVVDAGSLTENVAIAAQTGLPVVAVRYRLLPDHRYPAALEDALKVYRALLETHDAARIGLYGTSAGAILSGELVARLKADKLPLPGALGFFSGGSDFSRLGDSVALFADLRGAAGLARMYSGQTALTDPVLSPARGDLSDWPPTMCVTSGRDFLQGSTARLCSALRRAGVPAELWLYDGLPHAFWAYIDAPETDEAFADMAAFLSRTVGAAR